MVTMMAMMMMMTIRMTVLLLTMFMKMMVMSTMIRFGIYRCRCYCHIKKHVRPSMTTTPRNRLEHQHFSIFRKVQDPMILPHKTYKSTTSSKNRHIIKTPKNNILNMSIIWKLPLPLLVPRESAGSTYINTESTQRANSICDVGIIWGLPLPPLLPLRRRFGAASAARRDAYTSQPEDRQIRSTR